MNRPSVLVLANSARVRRVIARSVCMRANLVNGQHGLGGARYKEGDECVERPTPLLFTIYLVERMLGSPLPIERTSATVGQKRHLKIEVHAVNCPKCYAGALTACRDIGEISPKLLLPFIAALQPLTRNSVFPEFEFVFTCGKADRSSRD